MMETQSHMTESPLFEHEETPFVGRENELISLLESFTNTIVTCTNNRLADGTYLKKLAVVTGSLLVGKSRFAREASKVLEKWSTCLDVQLHIHSIEVKGLDNPWQVEAKMATALLLRQQDGIVDLTRGLDALDNWHLFILDGAEEFGDNPHQTAFMNLCQDVISGSSKILLIITTRWNFGFVRIPNQVLQICVNPLSSSESEQLLLSIAPNTRQSWDKSESKCCFEEISILCGGSPFALELVGTELRDEQKTPEEIAAELRKRNSKRISSGDDTDDNKNREEDEDDLSRKVRGHLEPLIERAVDGLESDLKKRFAALSFIPGSFTADAAAAITNINPTGHTKRALLRPLYTRSLIAVDTLTNRFNIFSFLRSFIEERYSLLLAPSETSIIRGRYCGFYARLLQRAAELLEKDDAWKSIPIFTGELQNMQKLLQEVIHCPDESYTLFIEVAHQARQLILQFIPNHDAIKFYEACLEAAEKRKDTRRRARILISLGRLVRYVDGDMRYAEDLYRSALGLLAPLGDGLDHAATLTALGFHFFDSAQPKLSISYHEEALEMIGRLERRLDESPLPDKDNEGASTKKQLLLLKSQALHILAATQARLNGNCREGISCHTQSIAIQSKLWKDHLTIGQNYECMAIVYHHLGEKEQALHCTYQALNIIERLCTEPATTLSICYYTSAMIIFDCGDEKHKQIAQDLIQKARKVQERLQTRSILKFCFLFIDAKMTARSGDLAKARKMFHEGYKLALPILGKHLNTARALQSEGWSALQLGDYEGATDVLLQCLEMRKFALKTMKWNIEIAETLETLGDVHASINKDDDAVNFYQKCVEALSAPIKSYTKIGAKAANEVRDLRAQVTRKMETVGSLKRSEWSLEDHQLFEKTVIYEYNYWPMI